MYVTCILPPKKEIIYFYILYNIYTNIIYKNERKKPDTKGQIYAAYMRCLQWANSQRQEQTLPEVKGREKWDLLFHGYRVSVCDDENAQDMDGGNGCTQCECN